jgi:hypothetical protein
MLFQKRKRSVNSIYFVAGALISGIALGITAHKFAPEIRSRVQGLMSNIDLNPFDDHTKAGS